ncbi:lipase/acyltransferase domain-containing protein [Roseateles sp.]|uniref:lipase/acyltransferase domain-containing protein n=1 Tax=Roseateles sp. TaxID=1971397 RepID=UPI003267C2F4
MNIKIIAAVLTAVAPGAFAAGTSPGSVIEGFVRAGFADRKLAASVSEIQKRPVIVLVPGILGSKLSSPSLGGVFWGKGIPDLEKLKLPANLIDEKAKSDVQATLLESYFGDQYGDAFVAIKAAAAKVGIDAVACGYDWRRDLRSGAADLEGCITREFGTTKRTLIFVSHSMGGIVTSAWNAKHDAKQYSPQHLVGGIVLLGSPLQGSCEVLRMIREGYRQPDKNGRNAGKRFEYLYVEWDNLRQGIANDLTAWATDGVRDALLTWPGAFGLTPKPTNVDTNRTCVKVYPSEQPGGPNVISYYEPQFWATVTGKEVLNGAKPPAHFNAVLAKAKEFRNGFSLVQPHAPLYAFYSMYWSTPEVARLGADGHLNATDTWNPEDGDGRVSMPAGGSRPEASWLSHYWPISSVHGGLPKDPEFQQIFLAGRLPRLVEGLTAYELITELGKEPGLVAAYAKVGGAVPVVDEFKGALDVAANSAEPPKSPLGREIEAAVDAFRSSVCRSTQACSVTYRTARKQNLGFTERASTYAGVMSNESGLPWDKATATAQVGLAKAKVGEFRSAGPVLATASLELGRNIEEADISEGGRNALSDLKQVVDRNLAIALRESGQCVAAKKLLESLPASKTKYSADLEVKCLDRDTAVYQALGEF